MHFRTYVPSPLLRIGRLVTQYQPDVLVVEDSSARGARRCQRVRRLLQTIKTLAAKKNVKTRSISRARIRRVFSESGKMTKHEIALAIVKRLPALAPRLPPPRRAWMSEDYRMSIFDAVALALTFFHHQSHRKTVGEAPR